MVIEEPPALLGKHRLVKEANVSEANPSSLFTSTKSSPTHLMSFLLVSNRPPPKFGAKLINLFTNGLRELETTHNIRRNSLGHCFDKSLFPSHGEQPFFPALEGFPNLFFHFPKHLVFPSACLGGHVEIVPQRLRKLYAKNNAKIIL